MGTSSRITERLDSIGIKAMQQLPVVTSGFMPRVVDHHRSFEYQQIIETTTTFVTSYFDSPRFDASHDIQHVLRVRDNALYILGEEYNADVAQQSVHMDPLAVHLAALLHDVDDKKYRSSSASALEEPEVITFMNKVAPDLAMKVYEIVEGVSYSSEIKNPAKVLEVVQRHPELAIVQDADRLDAIGSIGIGRCFTFGGARGTPGMGNAIEHFEEKLLRLESMMKTGTGKTLAAKRTQRIRQFMAWWKDEAGPMTASK